MLHKVPDIMELQDETILMGIHQYKISCVQFSHFHISNLQCSGNQGSAVYPKDSGINVGSVSGSEGHMGIFKYRYPC